MRTKQELVNAIFWQLKDKALNRKEISQALGYKAKSPHLLKVLETLTEEGVLIKTEYLTHNNLVSFTYYSNQLWVEKLENQKALVS